MGDTDDTTKTSSGNAYVTIVGAIKDGTGVTTPGAGANLFAVKDGTPSATKFIVDEDSNIWNSGMHLINVQSNPWMTIGITINQGAADNEILTFRSSDIAHNMTDLTNSGTYGTFCKANATAGGLWIRGFTETIFAAGIQGCASVITSTHSTSGGAAILMDAAEMSNYAVTTVDDASGNLFAVRNYQTTAFIVCVGGNFYYDGAGAAYDEYDDVALCQAFDKTIDPLERSWDDWTTTNRNTLARLGVVEYNDDGHNFVNGKQLARLHNGAIRQLAERCDRYEKALLTLGVDPLLLAP
jgi:hypothetical protein